MTTLRIDEQLLEEIRHRLTLRTPNADAIKSAMAMLSQHYDVEGKAEPFHCIIDSATGVGKTFIMVGIVEYLAGIESPTRNFLILTPGRTIRDKTVRNFTPGDSRAITPLMRSNPFLVTADNFKSSATAAALADTTRTKVYVFTVQALTSSTGDGRETHEYQESLGASLYDWLGKLDDLVILADEHHCYRGPAFSRTIENLKPAVVIGVTATPDKKDEDLVVFRYPLAQAIEDRYVKSPVLVARQDDRHDDRTKLLDGVTLLKHKERIGSQYATENGLPPVRPVMLVVAKSIEDAKVYRDILDSVSFDAGAWVGKTLLVHSQLTGDEKEQALASLDAVEDPDSPVRIIISIGMLKEGWDVKNVYVIASMRASVSEVLTEQTLGRGMRLPFQGKYTGEQMLDTLEVLAHEKYEELLKNRQVLSKQMIDYRVLTEVRTTGPGQIVARRRTEETALPFTVEPATEADVSRSADTKETSLVATFDSRIKVAEERAEDVPDLKRFHLPLAGREQIRIPYVQRVQQSQPVSLNQVLDRSPFEALGKALLHEAADTLKRTILTAKDGEIKGQKAEGVVEALALDTPLETSRKALIEHVMRVRGVERRPNELNAAAALVDTVISAMGDTAAENLSAYLDRAAKRLGSLVADQIRLHSNAGVVFSDAVHFAVLDKVREALRRHEVEHTDTFQRALAYNGWIRNAYEYSWFDSAPEYKAAAAIDDDASVVVWARLHRNDLPITWTQEGREYNPDFVVIEKSGDSRICWLVEVKMDKEMQAADVIAKKKAAKTWANTINNSGLADGRWQYLLLSETDVNDAGGSWAQMKSFGQ